MVGDLNSGPAFRTKEENKAYGNMVEEPLREFVDCCAYLSHFILIKARAALLSKHTHTDMHTFL